jgi:hypothetical protein
MADEPIIFLVVEDVLELHAAGLEKYGGAAGIRDRHALESAVMQPQASFGGEFLYEDVFAMAAAYAFHIAEAHPLGARRAARRSVALASGHRRCASAGSHARRRGQARADGRAPGGWPTLPRSVTRPRLRASPLTARA